SIEIFQYIKRAIIHTMRITGGLTLLEHVLYTIFGEPLYRAVGIRIKPRKMFQGEKGELFFSQYWNIGFKQ
ncbi:MAG TPA: hypothetical protein PLM29_14780, partial [Deltaproteobacteria bacterium]|nr:hypothetical protein [Deltaproteobacteria bacterium]